MDQYTSVLTDEALKEALPLIRRYLENEAQSHKRRDLTRSRKLRQVKELHALLEASGVYDYTITGGPTIQAYLDMDTENGPWIVIQRRTSPNVNFYRHWANYKNGFGNLHGNFWLGNDNIHLLTSNPMVLRVVLEGWDGTKGYAQYSSFQIANEAQNYRLSVSGFSGTISTNALGSHDGYDFTTRDRDNDVNNHENCASTYRGAWWYYDCLYSNLNGIYAVDVGDTDVTSMFWRDFPRSDVGAPLKKCTMMIRKP
ncbi:angiopoietin-related protein 7-like [Argopecten irradians]|uniref:angiopoietin-related protein 7-like n=1 Tax=Argopecten irradians TaxID=31199 RepID=UPI00371C522A